MKTASWLTLLVLVCLTMTVSACGTSPIEDSPITPTQPPDVNMGTQEPVTATDTPVPPTPTDTVVTVDDTPADRDLTEEQILQIVRFSLAAFPWRLEQTVLEKGTGQTSTTVTEAQSSTRGYNQSVQILGGETITVESMRVDSTFYLKITGSPAETYGLVSGEWKEIPPDSPMAQLIDTGAIDPAMIAETFSTDFASISGGSGTNKMVFTIIGSEDVNGVMTDIYESKGADFTYRWWIGSDGRFYKSTVDIPQATRTILVEYDPGINIQPPIP